MTIPIRPPLANLQLLQDQTSRDHRQLNVALYTRCRREGLPLPRFERVGSRGQRFVSLEDQAAIAKSDEALEELARRHNLDPLIVQDIRRRAARSPGG